MVYFKLFSCDAIYPLLENSSTILGAQVDKQIVHLFATKLAVQYSIVKVNIGTWQGQFERLL